MTNPRFAVAKVIPDVTRMEPRNFGVIVWNRGQCASRFLSDNMDTDARQLARLELPSRDSFSQWIEYWNAQLKKPRLRISSGEYVQISDQRFLDALCDTSLENFQLVDAGYLTTSCPASKTKAVADSLFESLVLTRHPQPKQSRLRSICEKLFAPLAGNNKFHHDGLSVQCKQLDAEFSFTYGFGDPNQPDVLLQAVSLGKEDQVDAAATKFRCVSQDEKLIKKEQCACLVGGDTDSPVIRKRITFLNRFSEIVIVANLDIASAQLSRMGLPLSS